VSPHVCSDCFLFETRGVCPAAQSAHALETPAHIQARSEALRAAIASDAHVARRLFGLICSDAAQLASRTTGGTTPRVLSAAPSETTNESKKEKIDVISSGTD
jgi:hypothetical protein